MRISKAVILLTSALFIGGVSAADEPVAVDLEAGLAAAVASGQSLSDYVESAIAASPELAEMVLAFAIDKAGDDAAALNSVLAAAANANVNSDTILAVAVANGVDPATVESAVSGTETAGGNNGNGNGQGPEFGLTRARSRAAAPATPGFGGGSGGGGGTVSGN